MSNINWDSVGDSFEKHESLKLKLGDKVSVTFEDDGREVPKDVMKNSQFPRDAYVFTVSVGSDKKSFWVAKNAFSQLKELKAIRTGNKGTLEGVKAVIERISNKTNETNYSIKKR